MSPRGRWALVVAASLTISSLGACEKAAPQAAQTSPTATAGASCVEATRNGDAAHLRLPPGLVRHDDPAPIHFSAFRYDSEPTSGAPVTVIMYPWTAGRSTPATDVLSGHMGAWFSSDAGVVIPAGQRGTVADVVLPDGTRAPSWTYTGDSLSDTDVQTSLSIWLVTAGDQRFGVAVAAPVTAEGGTARAQVLATVAAGPCDAATAS